MRDRHRGARLCTPIDACPTVQSWPGGKATSMTALASAPQTWSCESSFPLPVPVPVPFPCHHAPFLFLALLCRHLAPTYRCGYCCSYVVGTEPLWTQSLLQHLSYQIQETLHAVLVYGRVCGPGRGCVTGVKHSPRCDLCETYHCALDCLAARPRGVGAGVIYGSCATFVPPYSSPLPWHHADSRTHHL